MNVRMEHVTNLQIQIHTFMPENCSSNGFLPVVNVRCIHKHLVSLLVIFTTMLYFNNVSMTFSSEE